MQFVPAFLLLLALAIFSVSASASRSTSNARTVNQFRCADASCGTAACSLWSSYESGKCITQWNGGGARYKCGDNATSGRMCVRVGEFTLQREGGSKCDLASPGLASTTPFVCETCNSSSSTKGHRFCCNASGVFVAASGTWRRVRTDACEVNAAASSASMVSAPFACPQPLIAVQRFSSGDCAAAFMTSSETVVSSECYGSFDGRHRQGETWSC